MSPPNVVIQKRRFFSGKVGVFLVMCIAVVLCGAMIQLRMTWSREQLRGLTSEAEDVVAAAKAGAEHVKPEQSPVATFLNMFTSFSEQTSQ